MKNSTPDMNDAFLKHIKESIIFLNPTGEGSIVLNLLLQMPFLLPSISLAGQITFLLAYVVFRERLCLQTPHEYIHVLMHLHFSLYLLIRKKKRSTEKSLQL